MAMLCLLVCGVCCALELPAPRVTLDFERELPEGLKLVGEATVGEGHTGKGLHLVRPTAVEDLTRLVYEERGQHCGFPCLLRLHTGELLACFRRGPGHVGRGVIMQMRSTDEGASWSPPRVIFEDPKWDSRSHSTGLELRSGTLLLGFYRHSSEAGFTGARVLRSTDAGATWQAIDLPNPAYTPNYVYNIGRPLQLADGTVLMPYHGEVRETKRKATGVLRSTDDGLTWGDFSLIAHGGRDYWEAGIAALPTGELLAMNRNEPGPFMWQCRSGDGGRTWTTPESSGLQGDVGELLVLQSGSIVCAYRSQEPGTADTRASLSRDGGRTWQGEIVVDPNGGDRGYTSSVQLPDGRILMLNYSTKNGIVGVRSRTLREEDFNGSAPRPQFSGLEIPYARDWPLEQALTLAAWVRPGSEAEARRIFVREGVFSLYLNRQALDGWVWCGGAQDAVSKAIVPRDAWTHVAMTYAATDPAHHVRLYINGEEVEYAQVERTSGDHLVLRKELPIYVGSPEPQYGFAGDVDDVRVYDAALTPEQMSELAASSK